MAFSPAQCDAIQRIVADSISAALTCARHHDDHEDADRGTAADIGTSDSVLNSNHGRASIDPQSRNAQAASCSSLAHIPQDIVQKIKRVEYIGLALLLPAKPGQAHEPPAKRFRLDEEGAFTICAPTTKRKIDSLASWVEAWSLFTFVAVSEFPECAEAFMQHQLRIVQAAGKYRLSAVLEYDVRVRQALATDSTRSLAVLDPELFATCFTGQALSICTSSKKTGNTAVNCSFRPSKVHNPSSSKPEVCKRFNAGVCQSSSCKYQHVCQFCAGQHPGKSCPARRSQ